ncbi:mucin-5B-like [Lethenteron reissneri]|uniref:mucin-5B-like n=1 Tax=Lethenteron reissneri TaxID=7753 RepID=UPI002AB665CE|nr:mucin-5B-like [Lethenteron reissneri]
MGATLCTCQNGVLDCERPAQVDNGTCSAPLVRYNCTGKATPAQGVGCAPSCQGKLTRTPCLSVRCEPGCGCPRGLLADGVGGCVASRDCPCSRNGRSYSSGGTVTSKCEKCTCRGGQWACQERRQQPCLSTCSVFGDGHYSSFDGRQFVFDGSCEYVVAQDYCGEEQQQGTFRVITENLPCGTSGTTCSRAVKIILKDVEIYLHDGNYSVSRVGSSVATSPERRHTVVTRGLYLVVSTAVGLTLTWDRRTSLTLSLPASYQGRVCGLCGNNNGDVSDDFVGRDGARVASAAALAKGWRASPSTATVAVAVDPCRANPYRQVWAQRRCAVIASDAFAECHAQVYHVPYLEACVHDACACDAGGDCECVCTAVAAYARACRDAGVCVHWRTPDMCPVFCDFYNEEGECTWHYSACSALSAICPTAPGGNLSSELNTLEGCYPRCVKARPYWDEEAHRCVALRECPCYVDDVRLDHNATNVIVATTTTSGNVAVVKTCDCVSGVPQCTDLTSTTPAAPTSPAAQLSSASPTKPDSDHSSASPTKPDSDHSSASPTKPDSDHSSASPTKPDSEHSSASPTKPDVAHTTLSTSPSPVSGKTPASTTVRKTPATQETTATLSSPGLTTFTSNVASTEFTVKPAEWTPWLNVSVPTPDNEGDIETIERIRSTGVDVCSEPVGVQCQAVMYPGRDISTLGQKVICDRLIGLICRNADQSGSKPLCLDYTVKFFCGPVTRPPPTKPTAATSSVASGVSLSWVTTPPSEDANSTEPDIKPAEWTRWFDVDAPTPDNEGDIETIQKVRSTGVSVCSEPVAVQCEAVMYPGRDVATLGQKVICDRLVGLICRNADQNGTRPLCLNYAVKFFCAPPTRPPTTTTTKLTTVVTPSIAPPVSLKSASSPTPADRSPGAPGLTKTTTTVAGPTPAASTELTVKPAEWTPWLNVSVPTPDNEGDIETIERIRNAGVDVCSEPVGVQCQAVMYPGRDISTLGQKVICDRLIGLICRNADQSGSRPLCLDYTVKFFCGPVTRPPPTRPTAASSSVAPGVSLSPVTTSPSSDANSTEPDIKPAEWTRWFDVDAPTPDNEGDIETIQKVRSTGVSVCSEPVAVQCEAVMYPGRDVATLGQKVICDRLVGLICRNADQNGTRPLCLNYAVKFFCAPPARPKMTTTTTRPTSPFTAVSLPGSATTDAKRSSSGATSPQTLHPVATLSLGSSRVTTESVTALSGPSPSLPAPSAETPPPADEWTPWLDVDSPTPDNGGDVETIERIRSRGFDVCAEPVAVQCRAVMYPGRDVSTLGQAVTCERLLGLVCRNADQSAASPLCLNYAVRFLCRAKSNVTTTTLPGTPAASAATTLSPATVCKELERPMTPCVSLFVDSCTGAQRAVTAACDQSAAAGKECPKRGSFAVATTRPGECCPHYQCVCPEDCAVPACSPGSVLMELMESSAQSSCCRNYECVLQPSPTCEYNGKMYQVGDQWSKDNCSFLECAESQGSALLSEHRITCLEPQYPHTCANVSVVYDVHGCCITYKCNDEAPQEICQPQRVWTLVSVGGCSSEGPVEVTKCVGACSSSSLPNPWSSSSSSVSTATAAPPQLWRSSCSCCRETSGSGYVTGTATATITGTATAAFVSVPLLCPNGTALSASVAVAQRCRCVVADCPAP